ncbi:cytochrome P450 [Streptantibioticus rubrisoli]|uniref:Cytochrome P450 n=1 Tax=Streptantibioticus rubrisoli TaxID=1387313 RepID=A0ABT1P9H9_9ACTN|nr:cytochrome P450 [Streptantibioticus rubrisoli]MCQ4040995.1 cytochrome P450 [Streptantibioticus rubrisoli]
MESHVPPASSAAASSQLESLPVEPLMTRDFGIRPALVYQRLRERYGPVAPVELFGVPVWLVLGFREVLEVLRDESRWKKDVRHWRALQQGRIPSDWPLLPAYGVDQLLVQDDQRRATTRAAVDAALRPFQDPRQPQARALASAVSRQVDELITVFADGGGSGWVDLCAQFARPLPLMVVNRLFGFQVEQGDEILMDAWRMMDSGPDAADAIERLVTATTELAAHKRSQPGDDLTSRLLAAEPSLTVEQVGRELYAILVAIADTTSHAITNGVLEVLTGNSGARASLAAGLIGELVNRVHIASPPWSNLTFRFPVADTSLGGFRVAAGDVVMPSIAAAHGDPLFADAVNQDSTMSSRAHLAWGAGPHQCPGRGLADMMVSAAVGRLFERCDLQLDVSVDQLPWRSSTYVRGMRSFPVRFRMRAQPGPVPGTGSARPAAESESAAPAKATQTTEGDADADQSRPALRRFMANLRKGVPVIGDGMVH